ncbi:TPA: hypothetical protein RU589_004518 [Salmonella enterica]|nr:hypothetical protein [Salmonella enterica]HEA0351467.1 hypothetical protein [Salmonella enterica]HEA0384376.1 hypothetical protein [Salmonella enterica]
MRPQQADNTFGQFGVVIIEFLPNTPHQEGKALEQAGHRLIHRTVHRQSHLPGLFRMQLSKLPRRITQVAHFGVEVAEGQVVH